LKADFIKYGFFELEKVKTLNIEKQDELYNKIKKESIPYVIALFDFLGFIQQLEDILKAKYKVHKIIAKWFNVSKDGRSVKANISTLTHNSTEDKKRYTAYKYKETVKIYYQNLK
jgi:hypothetical protein